MSLALHWRQSRGHPTSSRPSRDAQVTVLESQRKSRRHGLSVLGRAGDHSDSEVPSSSTPSQAPRCSCSSRLLGLQGGPFMPVTAERRAAVMTDPIFRSPYLHRTRARIHGTRTICAERRASGLSALPSVQPDPTTLSRVSPMPRWSLWKHSRGSEIPPGWIRNEAHSNLSISEGTKAASTGVLKVRIESAAGR